MDSIKDSPTSPLELSTLQQTAPAAGQCFSRSHTCGLVHGELEARNKTKCAHPVGRRPRPITPELLCCPSAHQGLQFADYRAHFMTYQDRQRYDRSNPTPFRLSHNWSGRLFGVSPRSHRRNFCHDFRCQVVRAPSLSYLQKNYPHDFTST